MHKVLPLWTHVPQMDEVDPTWTEGAAQEDEALFGVGNLR